MISEINTNVFLETIVDAGANVFTSEFDTVGPVRFEDYMHPTSKHRVTICVSEEFIPVQTALQYLVDLNMVFLVHQGIFDN